MQWSRAKRHDHLSAFDHGHEASSTVGGAGTTLVYTSTKNTIG
jgi:hypothetical protein